MALLADETRRTSAPSSHTGITLITPVWLGGGDHHQDAMTKERVILPYEPPGPDNYLVTTHLARMVEAFNAGRLDEVVARTTDDYHYSDPINGRVDGANAHKALMQAVLTRFPNRMIEMLRSWSAADAEFGEYRWSGTPADGGEPKQLIFATIVELEGDRVRRWANFTG